MKHTRYKFSNSSVDYYFDASFSHIGNIADKKKDVIVTDENIFSAYQSKFKGWNTIVLKPGEYFKVQSTVDSIVEQLIDFEADRKSMLIGVGGGVVTDITGYAASVYMRGISFGFVPTTLLAMVDAAIGGKNGIDVGIYKNLVGVIRQPQFILYDVSMLTHLPEKEWVNGFAEIIKHGCIGDAQMFRAIELKDLSAVKKDKMVLSSLIRRNAELKSRIVQRDEFESGERRLLNFGHTLGHALENQYELSHGEAVAIGMTYASAISEKLNGFKESLRIVKVLEQYGLPTFAEFDKKSVMDVLKMDKKRERENINFVLLQKIGKAEVRPIPINDLDKMIHTILLEIFE
jgi:3-dehydroquinate synthase